MRKENMTYYFSVEGETEKWYLDWLQNCINECTVSTVPCQFVLQSRF